MILNLSMDFHIILTVKVFCEIVHKTIKTGFILIKLDNKSNFNLKETLEETVKAYNNTINSVTNITIKRNKKDKFIIIEKNK